MKILHLLSQRPDSTGSGIYVQAMIREAAACGNDNYLVAGIGPHDRADMDFIARDRALFVPFERADIPFPIPGMSDVMPYESTRFGDLSEEALAGYEKAFAGRLQQAVEAFAPDIIHSHHLWIVSSLARRLFPDAPMVTSCHGSDLRQFQNCPHLRKRVLSGCRKLDVVVALSAAQKKDIIRLYGMAPEKIRVAGAGYHERLFYEAPKPVPDPVQLVYAGKLSRAKGVPWLLRALQSVRFPAWRLHLVGGGSGAEKAECLRLAKAMGSSVCVHGALPQQRLAAIVRKSHILVLPSFYEGLPLVVLEGLASGCRVVATDLPGTREVLGNADVDFITLVKPPRLRHTDQPYREDENAFEQNLETAIKQQMTAAFRAPQLDLSPVRDEIDSFAWAGIYQKVKKAYQLARGISK